MIMDGLFKKNALNIGFLSNYYPNGQLHSKLGGKWEMTAERNLLTGFAKGYTVDGRLQWTAKGDFIKLSLNGHNTVEYYFYEDGSVTRVEVTGNWKEGKVQGQVTAETTVDGKLHSTYEGEADSPAYHLAAECLQEKYGVDQWYFMHGQGKITYADGSVGEGRWEKGRPLKPKSSQPSAAAK